MITKGEKASAIVERKGLGQISDTGAIKEIVQKSLMLILVKLKHIRMVKQIFLVSLWSGYERN